MQKGNILKKIKKFILAIVLAIFFLSSFSFAVQANTT
jgi:hypothetical protein